MTERDRIANLALALCYTATAVVVVIVYREPLRLAAREVGAWYRARRAAMPQSVRPLRGKLWDDVNGAIDDAR